MFLIPVVLVDLCYIACEDVGVEIYRLFSQNLI